jgi:hypothetical protein
MTHSEFIRTKKCNISHLSQPDNILPVLRIRVFTVYPVFGLLTIPIPDPGFRIPDPTTATKEAGGKNLLVYLSCSNK